METTIESAATQSKPNLLIVTNGYSFGAAEMQPKLDALAALPERWGDVSSIQTTVDNTYLDTLLPKITPGSTVVISGGDDTVRRTLLGLQNQGYTGEEIDILITGAGGENVVAQTLHGEDYKDPLTILQNSRKRAIFHTEATLSDEDGKPFRTENFIFSFSMGAGALAMRRYFNRTAWREAQHRRSPAAQWLVKRLCAVGALAQSRPFRTSKGRALDVTISGGEFSAGRTLKYDTNLSSRHQNMLSVTRYRNLLTSLIGRKLRWGIAPGDTWHGGYGTIRIDGNAEAQIDGNNIADVPKGTIIRFERAKQGIAVLACQQQG